MLTVVTETTSTPAAADAAVAATETPAAASAASGSKAAGTAMAFKLIEAAQARRRAINAPRLVALVRAGAHFERGKLVERPTPSQRPANAA